VRKEDSVEKLKKQPNFYAREGEIKSIFYSNKPIIALVYKKASFNTNKLDPCIHILVVFLLQEFNDVFPEDIPNGLPLIRGIEHQIDLVPRVMIPKRLAY
jgi:hypothetical protein